MIITQIIIFSISMLWVIIKIIIFITQIIIFLIWTLLIIRKIIIFITHYYIKKTEVRLGVDVSRSNMGLGELDAVISRPDRVQAQHGVGRGHVQPNLELVAVASSPTWGWAGTRPGPTWSWPRSSSGPTWRWMRSCPNSTWGLGVDSSRSNMEVDAVASSPTWG